MYHPGMARPLRIEYEGAWHHVMNRGAGRKRIFKSDGQREYFLSLLDDTCKRYNAEWHAYCLMSNHYHLMVRTPESNLQRIMRHINGLYTQYFNRAERRDGPLFRGRYKAILVDADTYWLELSRYIHRNPLQAGVVADLADYRWSSYRAYVGLDSPPSWLTTGFILNALGRRNRHKRYAAFVAEASDEAVTAFYSKSRIDPVLGEAEFKANVLAGQALDIDRPELRAARTRPSLAQIVETTCRRFGVEEGEIWRVTRGKGVTSPARAVAMYLCQEHAAMRLSEIAELFGLASYASAGSGIRNLKRRLEEDAVLANDIKSILLDLTA